MFFHCGINEHLDQVWVWRSPLWIYFREQLGYKGGLGKFVDSFRSSIASPHFSHFFLPLPIYEFLALVGGFKEMWKKKKRHLQIYSSRRNGQSLCWVLGLASWKRLGWKMNISAMADPTMNLLIPAITAGAGHCFWCCATIKRNGWAGEGAQGEQVWEKGEPTEK